MINEKSGILNEKCGADFVHTHKVVPELDIDYKNLPDTTLFASFDGDADRLILFTLKKSIEIIDGDTQAVIIANYISSLLEKLNLKLRIGVILSFYSNGGCLQALEKFETEMVQTGVKNFVSAARKYDIGIYFEPNGHGSVMFSNAAVQAFITGNTTEHKILETISQLFDPNIGDALANLLIYKCIIQSPKNLKQYNDNGSRLLTVRIKNKNYITTNDQNEVVNPNMLQDRIYEEAERVEGRAFVRPSGTEDLVRVYAECTNQQDADLLALRVAQLVYDMCDGIGNHPEIDYYNK